NGLNLGVDFIGGQSIRVTFTQSATAPIAEVREEINRLDYGEPVIQQVGAPNRIAVRMKLPDAEDTALTDKMVRDIRGVIEQHHADARIDGVESVSGKVSDELFQTG